MGVLSITSLTLSKVTLLSSGNVTVRRGVVKNLPDEAGDEAQPHLLGEEPAVTGCVSEKQTNKKAAEASWVL